MTSGAAATFRKVPGFDFGDWGLRRLPATEWHGLIFVDTSGGAAGSLNDTLASSTIWSRHTSRSGW